MVSRVSLLISIYYEKKIPLMPSSADDSWYDPYLFKHGQCNETYMQQC